MCPKGEGEKDAWKKEVQKSDPSSSAKSGKYDQKNPDSKSTTQRSSETGKFMPKNPGGEKTTKPGDDGAGRKK